MKQCIKQGVLVLTLGLAGTLTTVGIGLFAAENVPGAQDKDKAVERTRQEIKMLDDLYKNAIVLMNEHYVNKPCRHRRQGVVRGDEERRVA
jgi:hypothetical protein